MTPKEKAGWLNERFYFSLPNNGSFTGPNNINDRWEEAKKCALIAVDQTIETSKDIYDDTISNTAGYTGHLGMRSYWKEVKQEIEKL